MASPRVGRPFPLIAALLSATAAGCGSGDGIESYTVPRASNKGGAAGEYRILGAVYPSDNPVWYFKLTGSAADLAKHEADFDKFIASVKLKGDGVPDFKLPDGWTRGGPRDVSRGGVTVRFEETIKFDGLEMTISRSQGGLAGNVERWAGQVGLRGTGQALLDQYTRFVPADGWRGVRVDLKGKQNPAGGPMMGGGR